MSNAKGNTSLAALRLITQFFLADAGDQRILPVKTADRADDRRFQFVQRRHVHEQFADSRDLSLPRLTGEMRFDHRPRPARFRDQFCKTDSGMTAARDASQQNRMSIAARQNLQKRFQPRHSGNRQRVEHNSATDRQDRRELAHDEAVARQE